MKSKSKRNNGPVIPGTPLYSMLRLIARGVAKKLIGQQKLKSKKRNVKPRKV